MEMGMKFWIRESERIKKNRKIQENIEEDMVIFLSNWKSKVRRYRIYRGFLWVCLTLSVMAFVGMGYYVVDSSIPSIIRVREGEEEIFDFGIPAKAEMISVGVQGKSNIPPGAVTIDLNQPVTLKSSDWKDCLLEVKLFGFLPFKQVDVQVIEDQELIPVGMPIGIYVETDGILVIGVGEFTGQDGVSYSPSKYILKSGDYIQKLNGETMADKDSFIKKIEECDGSEQVISVMRNGELIDLKVKPVRDQNGIFRIGAWVRDNVQGVGTMTYMDADGHFGALGHGISDVDTSTLMEMDDGTLYQTEIVAIHKGKMGNPGEMVGMIVYSDEHILGDITTNSVQGIFGECNEKAINNIGGEPMPIGLKQEIIKGPARIYCTVDETAKYFDIEIVGIHLDNDNVNRGLEIKVTDPALLEITGGIVQGMSGSPIIQDGKIIGAVTHVLVNDPTRGYGIFIENMLEH